VRLVVVEGVALPAATAAVAGLNAIDELLLRELGHGTSLVHGDVVGGLESTSEENAARKALFAQMDAEIELFNSTETTSTHGHNFMSDYTVYERSRMSGTWAVDSSQVTEDPIVSSVPDWTTGVNWVTAGAVAPVKDQGQCGSCWAFSSVGTLESAYHIAMHKTGTVTQFSEQQLVDCVKSCYGCSGGW